METLSKNIGLVVYGTIFILVFLVAFLGFIFYYLKKFYRYESEKKRMKLEFENELSAIQLEIQEQTLQHISREIHDNLGHIASLIKINLNTLQLSNLEESTQKINATKDLSRRLLMDIKSISVKLGSDRIAQTGLAMALETEVSNLNKTGEFNATYLLLGNMPFIENDKAIILYRMVQEVLNNMIKHSRAKQIKVFLNTIEKTFILALSDDGVGFNICQKMNSGGNGLRNLQNRARLLKATLSMQSTPGKGSSVTISLPL